MGMDVVTFATKHGPISVYRNDHCFYNTMAEGKYWDDESIDANVQHIRAMGGRNMIEIGCHVGTDTVPYARALAPGAMLFGFEPQQAMFELLCKNVCDNGLADRVVLHNAAAFHFTGHTSMKERFLDGPMVGRPVVEASASGQACNYGGLNLGTGGQPTPCYKLDDLPYLNNVGFIHCDAQGAEPFVFWGARQLLRRERPVIFYENMHVHGTYLYDSIVADFAPPQEAREFDVKTFCMEELDYKTYAHGLDSLLVP